MTRKERVITAIAGGGPDKVPVVLGLSEGVPVRHSGMDYIEFFLKERVPLWKARIKTSVDYFSGDGYVHVPWGPGPHDPEVETVVRRETAEEVIFDRITHTSEGDLCQTRSVGRNHTLSTLAPMSKDPEADEKKILCMLQHPDEVDFSKYREAYDWVGDRGMVGLWIRVPIDWWVAMRGGPEAVIMDTVDRPEVLSRLFAAYTEYMTALVDHALATISVDSVGLGGSSTSMSVISPSLHRRYSVGFGKSIVKVCAAYSVPTQYHMCGRCRTALPITAEMGVSGFDALECPPTGDVDLREVKETFGGQFSLKGNVNSITVMLNGNPNDVARDVERCMEAAKEGGGYVCSVGDQCPTETPDENIFALVEAARRLGRYA